MGNEIKITSLKDGKQHEIEFLPKTPSKKEMFQKKVLEDILKRIEERERSRRS